MMARYLWLAFFLAFRNVQCPDSGRDHLSSGASTSQTDPGFDLHSSHTAKSGDAELGTNNGCQSDCLALQEEVSSMCEATKKNMIMQFLCNICGVVTDGYYGTVPYLGVCLCVTADASKERKISLFICRSALQMVRVLAKVGVISERHDATTGTMKRTSSKIEDGSENIPEVVSMQRWSTNRSGTNKRVRSSSSSSSPPNPRPNPSLQYYSARNNPGPSSAPRMSGSSSSLGQLPPRKYQEEDFNSKPDGLPEGDMLYTYVRIGGNDVVRALVNTGSAFTMIGENFVSGFVRCGAQYLTTVSNDRILITGKATIDLEVKPGIPIRLTGIVVPDQTEALVLGTEFLVTHKANIRIRDNLMDIFIGQNLVSLTIRFRSFGNEFSVSERSHLTYTHLKISGFLNEQFEMTRLDLDTGASTTIVNRKFVSEPKIRGDPRTCVFPGASVENCLGITDITLKFCSVPVTKRVLVPDFTLTGDLLLGNDFNKLHVEEIDYKSGLVLLRFLDPRKRSIRTWVKAYFVKG